ncbi:MAG: hypothetical protein V4632_12935 [Pseudomonadota bacterium]
MTIEQDWHTELYKGMDVHVSPLARDESHSSWDYTVRVTQPGDDSSAESELVAGSGDDADYPSAEEAVEAGFLKGYALVDELVE